MASGSGSGENRQLRSMREDGLRIIGTKCNNMENRLRANIDNIKSRSLVLSQTKSSINTGFVSEIAFNSKGKNVQMVYDVWSRELKDANLVDNSRTVRDLRETVQKGLGRRAYSEMGEVRTFPMVRLTSKQSQESRDSFKMPRGSKSSDRNRSRQSLKANKAESSGSVGKRSYDNPREYMKRSVSKERKRSKEFVNRCPSKERKRSNDDSNECVKRWPSRERKGSSERCSSKERNRSTEYFKPYLPKETKRSTDYMKPCPSKERKGSTDGTKPWKRSMEGRQVDFVNEYVKSFSSKERKRSTEARQEFKERKRSPEPVRDFKRSNEFKGWKRSNEVEPNKVYVEVGKSSFSKANSGGDVKRFKKATDFNPNVKAKDSYDLKRPKGSNEPRKTNNRMLKLDNKRPTAVSVDRKGNKVEKRKVPEQPRWHDLFDLTERSLTSCGVPTKISITHTRVVPDKVRQEICLRENVTVIRRIPFKHVSSEFIMHLAERELKRTFVMEKVLMLNTSDSQSGVGFVMNKRITPTGSREIIRVPYINKNNVLRLVESSPDVNGNYPINVGFDFQTKMNELANTKSELNFVSVIYNVRHQTFPVATAYVAYLQPPNSTKYNPGFRQATPIFAKTFHSESAESLDRSSYYDWPERPSIFKNILNSSSSTSSGHTPSTKPSRLHTLTPALEKPPQTTIFARSVESISSDDQSEKRGSDKPATLFAKISKPFELEEETPFLKCERTPSAFRRNARNLSVDFEVDQFGNSVRLNNHILALKKAEDLDRANAEKRKSSKPESTSAMQLPGAGETVNALNFRADSSEYVSKSKKFNGFVNFFKKKRNSEKDANTVNVN